MPEYEKTGAGVTRRGGGATLEVERGVNEFRLAILGIILSVGLTAGLGAGVVLWWTGLLAGIGSVASIVAVLKIRALRKRVMAAAYWLGDKYLALPSGGKVRFCSPATRRRDRDPDGGITWGLAEVKGPAGVPPAPDVKQESSLPRPAAHEHLAEILAASRLRRP